MLRGDIDLWFSLSGWFSPVTMHSAVRLRRLLLLCRGRGLSVSTARPTSSAAAPPDRPALRRLPADGPGLADFLSGTAASPAQLTPEPVTEPTPEPTSDLPSPLGVAELEHGLGRRVMFVVHGCQMNVNDTEVAWAVLQKAGYQRTGDIAEADVVLIMTCSIREGAETKIWNKLRNYKLLKASKGYTGAQFKVRDGAIYTIRVVLPPISLKQN